MISDDTQMSLFTANSILWCETRFAYHGLPPNIIAAMHESYLDWLECISGKEHEKKYMRSWIKDIQELKHNRAAGRTCVSSLSSGKYGTIDNPINNSKGCGGIMRVASIGLSHDILRNEVGRIAADCNAITHGHPLGMIASYIQATMISNIVYKKMNIEKALNSAIDTYKKDINICDEENEQIFMNLVNKAICLSQKNKSDIPF